MAFSENYIEPQRWHHFEFFATGGINGAIAESIAPGKIFKLHELRVHCSVVVADADNLVMRLSAAAGSAYNMTFLSKAMLNSTDVWYLFSNPLLFQSDDQLVITFSVASAANVVGITAVGWAALG